MASLGVSVPLQWDQRNRQDREVSARLAEATALRLELTEAARERLAETQTWYDSWRSELARLDAYRQTLIPLAAARTSAALAAYRGGEGRLSDVLEARRAEIETELERLRIEQDAARLWASARVPAAARQPRRRAGAGRRAGHDRQGASAMSLTRLFLVLLLLGALGIGGYGLYRLGLQQGADAGAPVAANAAPGANASTAIDPTAAPATETPLVDPSSWGIPEGETATRRHMADGLRAGQVDPVTGRKILYYHDPMVPGKNFEDPGKSPFMDMMLVPAYGGSAGADASDVSISPRMQQNLGLRTAPVTHGPLAPQVSAVGAIAWNERDQAMVQVRALGYVEKLHVRAELDPVTAGQPLVELYVPDWVAAQEEFLALQRMQGSGLAPLRQAARERMRQAGMDETQIQQVAASGRLQARTTIRAPIDGLITELQAHEGMTVLRGATLARINGIDTVWAHAEVPESQAALLQPGTPVSARTPALPGVEITGQVQTLLPQVDQTTRTLTARVVLRNPEGRLTPGLFVSMQFRPAGSADLLRVPSEALIHTGDRSLVMRTTDAGGFEPVAVQTGIEADGLTEIRRGLEAGQQVVISGQFLIDSEASLKGIEARLPPLEAAEDADAGMAMGKDRDPDAPPPSYRTRARVEAVDGRVLTLTHPAIPALDWPGMTMDFALAPELDDTLPANGSEIEIQFRLQQAGPPQIRRSRPWHREGE